MNNKQNSHQGQLPSLLTEKLHSIKVLFSGAVASALSRTITNPLERLKILKQLGIKEYQNKSITQSLIHMVKSEGSTSMLKGNLANILKCAPFTGLEFYFYEGLKKLGKGLNCIAEYKFLSQLAMGSVSGIAAGFIVYPLESIRTYLSINISGSSHALRTSGSIILQAKKIYKAAGIKGFYKGCAINSYGIAPFIGIKLSVFDVLKRVSPLGHFVNGSIATLLSTLCTYPFDLLKRVYQVKGMSSNIQTNVVKFSLKQVKSHGVKGLYKGMMAGCCKIVPANGMLFYLNEKLKMMI